MLHAAVEQKNQNGDQDRVSQDQLIEELEMDRSVSGTDGLKQDLERPAGDSVHSASVSNSFSMG
jgi:hypothetical protein